MSGKVIKKISTVTTVFFLISFCLLYSEKNGSGQEPLYGGVFRIKLFSDHFERELDPIKTGSSIFLSEQIYDGLVRLDKNFNVIPSLASYWEISPDGKKYTFHLKKGVLFHHGEELTSEDVKYSLERILKKENSSPHYHYFLSRVEGATAFREGKAEHVSGFRAKDKYTFEILWIKPYVSALYLMSMHFCKVLPKGRSLETGDKFFLNPSGTGPFAFEYWLRDTRLDLVGVRLKRNEGYFMGKPYLEAVEFCPLYNRDHFFWGEIDAIPLVSPSLLDSKHKVFEDSSINTAFLGMSCHIAPFDRPETRKAVGLGIGKEEIIRQLDEPQFFFQAVNNYIPPQLQGFFPDREDTKDLKHARQILDQQNVQFPVLLFFIPSPRSDYKYSIFKYIRSQLEALGIKLRLRYYENVQEIRNNEKPYLIYIEKKMNFPDPEDIIRILFFSRSVYNLFGYSSPELDRLLSSTELERSWTKRIELFQRIEQILRSDVPAIPLFNRQNRMVMQPYVKGVEEPALGFYYLEARKVWLDK